MGKFTKNLMRRLSKQKELSDPLHEELERSGDPMLTAVEITNLCAENLLFTSTLEQNSILEESAFWKKFILEPGKNMVFPHSYFEVTTETGREYEKAYSAKAAPRGSDFIYKIRSQYVKDGSKP